MERLSDSLALALRGEAGKNSTDPNLWVTTEVDHYLSERPYRIDPGWFHPSAFYTKCDAKLAWSFLGIAPQGFQEPRTQRIFDNGHGRDRYWKEYLHEAGLSIVFGEDERFCVIPELRIRGALDDIIRHPQSGQISVFEFKTMNSDQWKLLHHPLDYHYTQIHCYMYAKKIEHGVIAYECKNCQDIKMFEVEWNQQWWQEQVVNRIHRILTNINQKITPTRTPETEDKKCQFYWMCYNTEVAQVV